MSRFRVGISLFVSGFHFSCRDFVSGFHFSCRDFVSGFHFSCQDFMSGFHFSCRDFIFRVGISLFVSGFRTSIFTLFGFHIIGLGTLEL